MLLLIAGGFGGGWFALRVQLDAQEAQIKALQEAVAHVDNRLDDYTRAVLAATKKESQPTVPPKQ